MSPVSRRFFLQSLGVSAGAGLLFESMTALGLAPSARAADYRPPSAGELKAGAPRVVVLGAGIGGLATAYELSKAGYRCVVLEARNRVGGRNWTVREGIEERDLDGHLQRAAFSDGNYFNAGPARIAQSMVTLDYCRELDVAIEPFVNQNANAYVFHEKGGARPVRHRTAKADVYGYVSELLAKATDQGALDQQLTAEDKDRLLTFLERFGDIGKKADGWAYRGSPRRGYEIEKGAGLAVGKVLGPVPSLHEVLAAELGHHFEFEFEYEQAMAMFQPVGGMDRLADALYRAVGRQKVRLGSRVDRITNLSDGVEVVYTGRDGRQRAERADYCVAALPPHLLAKIPSNFDPAVTAALRFVRPESVGKMALEYRRRWWEQDERIYGGITFTDNDLGVMFYPSHGFHARSGLVVGYYNVGQPAETYSVLTPPERVRRALAQGARIHGERYRTDHASAFSVAWHRTPFLEGGWAIFPDYTTGEYELLTKPAGRVHFCGDWLSPLVGWQAGAFESARKVTGDVHRRVMAAN